MPSAAFEAALPFVLRWEGGFVDHPNDPGGRTNRGITQKVYDAWRDRQGQPRADVKFIADEDVHAIYESGYWLPPRCEVLPDPLPLVQFDTAVNMGVGRAVRFLQQSVGCGVDGRFGPDTLQATQDCDGEEAAARYCGVRENYYRRLAAARPELAVFLKGWLNRLDALRRQIDPASFGVEPAIPDFGDAGYIRRIPDLGESADFDL
jgi:lysozyme family protein